jgi:hypothetical protein
MSARHRVDANAALRFHPGAPPPEESDVISFLVGASPESIKRRAAPTSAAIVDRLLACWQILPSLPEELVNGAAAKILLPSDHRRLVNARLAVIAFQKAQIVGCRPLLQALEKNAVSYSILKGAAAACVLYPERYMRAAWDFDIGVSWNDLPAAETLALEAGFHQAERDADNNRFYRANRQLRAIVEKEHYELGYLVRRLQVTNLPTETLAAIRTEKWTHQFWHDAESEAPWCYAAADVHHSMSLEIGLKDLLATSHRISIGGETVRVPDATWLAAHLIYKLYWEGVHNYAKGLYQYCDLIRLLPKLDEAVVARVVEILETYNLIAAGYYTLKHLYKFGVTLPAHIVNFIADAQYPPAGGDPIGLNDLGDLWPKLWGRR